MNCNHVYLAFDHEINNSNRWLQARVFGACGYSAGTLLDRLTQRLVEIGLSPYVAMVRNTGNAETWCLPPPGTWINCGRALMEIESGTLATSIRQFLANQFEFFLHWAYCFVSICSVRGRTASGPAVLVIGVGEESLFVDKSDVRFVDYCRYGPITPLREGNRFLIQTISQHTNSCSDAISYVRHPLVALVRETRLGILRRCQLLANHLFLLVAYVIAAFRLPQLTLIGKDFAYTAISRGLDRLELIEAIVLTTSNFTSQPLWLREFGRAKVHMVSYSQNWKPIIYAADRLESDVPSFRWVRADKHWVWTHAFAEYLRNVCHADSIEVVGPILWYLPKMESAPTDLVELMIFDVPAFNDEVALSVGKLVNYYRPDHLYCFVRDIVSIKSKIESVFGLPVRLRLKTKRGYNNAIFDLSYYQFLEQLNFSEDIFLEHHASNMYSLISASHLVIAYPFTSPASVADALRVPSIYYDPTGSIVEHNFSDSLSLIRFANCPEDLLKTAVVAIREVLAKRAMQPVAAGDYAK